MSERLSGEVIVLVPTLGVGMPAATLGVALAKGLEAEGTPWRFTEKQAIAPHGSEKVPVLLDRDKPVVDSWAIAEYLEDTYPDRPSLFGGAGGRAGAPPRPAAKLADQTLDFDQLLRGGAPAPPASLPQIARERRAPRGKIPRPARPRQSAPRGRRCGQ